MGGSLLAMMLLASAQQPTDFGIRIPGARVSKPVRPAPAAVPLAAAPKPATTTGKPFSLSSAANIGSGWGRVTSTKRSPEHNRAVGGVPNSYHLSGRAIDIARRPGVAHSQIAAAYRQAGYSLLESLDEGDHSHFAFGTRPAGRAAVISLETVAPGTDWHIVYAPGYNK
jgi:hypothetical protein